MFRNTYQSGFLSILFSVGSKPLQIWDKKVKNGHIKRITDGDIQSSVLEICGTNVSTTYVSCPSEPKKVLGIKLPFLVIIVKNLKKFFTFEVTVLDDKNMHRRFRASNYQATTRVKPFICTMPLRLDDGWNQIQFNLADFVSRAYGSNYVEALRVQVHANARIRRIFFSDKLYSEAELPPEFKLVTPAARKEANAAKTGRGLGAPAAALAPAAPANHETAEEVILQDGAPAEVSDAAALVETVAAAATTQADTGASEEVVGVSANEEAPSSQEEATGGGGEGGSTEAIPSSEEGASPETSPALAGDEEVPAGGDAAPAGDSSPQEEPPAA